MLKLLSRLFQPRQAATKVVSLPVRGKYDAAQTTEDNRRHWAMADGLSAAAANSRTVRRTLRNRARYEVANNSYAKGIIATLANDVVGRGPILQVAAGAAETNTRIERAFSNWAIEVGLAQKLRTMRQSKAIDGETLSVSILGVDGRFVYSQIGFVNKKTARPIYQWELLRDFAQYGGKITWSDPAASAKLPKRKEALAKIFKAFFRIDGSPIELTACKKGWCCLFRVRAE